MTQRFKAPRGALNRRAFLAGGAAFALTGSGANAQSFPSGPSQDRYLGRRRR